MKTIPFSQNRPLQIVCFSLLGLLLLGLIAAPLVNRKITQWINGDGFRQMLNKETSKGLKFDADYGPLQRVGLLGMSTPEFHGTNGRKTIVSLEAHDISGSFNPFGIILRQWEIDHIHIQRGVVTIQKTEATPGAPKGHPLPPWWALFWPYRVELEDVQCDEADVLWQLGGKESGIYKTFLEITPNGKDFEYDGKGGQMRTPMTPPLEVQHVHLLIRKPRLYCNTFILGDDPAHPGQQVTLTGDAGLQDDRTMNLKIDLASLDLSRWVPEKYRNHILGHFSGHLDYTSTGTGLETASGHGAIHLTGGILRNLPQIHQYITLTDSPDPGDMPLKTCQMDLRWAQGAYTIENLQVESENIFKVTGTATLTKDKTIEGELQLGLTDPYLKWLPTAKTEIFTRRDGPYNVATIDLSGTSQKPQQDLSERVLKEISKSPGVAISLFFNQAANWFGGE